MPESSNIEIAQRLTEHRDAESSKKSWQDLVVEILEAVLLGVVAVATAWSAYHAASGTGTRRSYMRRLRHSGSRPMSS